MQREKEVIDVRIYINISSICTTDNHKVTWLSKYVNTDEYTASLESCVHKLESLVRKMRRNSK